MRLIALLLLPLTAAATERVVVDDHVAVACAPGAVPTNGDRCQPSTGGPLVGVSIAPPASGPVRLAVGPLALRPAHDGEMCEHQQFIHTFDRTAPMPVGREATLLPLPSTVYSKAVGDAVGIPNPKITTLLKVDLEGDGKDEVIFIVDSADIQLDAKGNATSYAFAGVRRIGADGQLKTHLLFKSLVRYPAAQVQDGSVIPIHYFAKLVGLTDVDGDGKLEVVIQDGFYEGVSTRVFRVGDGGAVKIGETGCGA